MLKFPHANIRSSTLPTSSIRVRPASVVCGVCCALFFLLTILYAGLFAWSYVKWQASENSSCHSLANVIWEETQAGKAYEFTLNQGQIFHYEQNTIDDPCHETYKKHYQAMTTSDGRRLQSVDRSLGGTNAAVSPPPPSPSPPPPSSPPNTTQLLRASLRALYESTSGGGWTSRSGWLSASDPCTWHGVTCQDSIVQLELHNNNLDGTLPSELFALPLGQLYAHKNRLSGTIPTEIALPSSSFSKLYLHGNGKISGTMPTELGELSKLAYFSLFHNLLSGTIPQSFGDLRVYAVCFLFQRQYVPSGTDTNRFGCPLPSWNPGTMCSKAGGGIYAPAGTEAPECTFSPPPPCGVLS